MTRRSRVLVTGAGGFIGAHVVDALLREGCEVRAIAGAPGQPVRSLPHEVESITADVMDTDAVTAAAKGIEAVVHLAGPASVAASFADPIEYFSTHAAGTLSVTQAMERAGVAHLVYLSSAEVYGRPDRNPVAENAPSRPRSPYGAAKAAGEIAATASTRWRGASAVILRPFSIYGPGAAPGSLVGTAVRQAIETGSIALADLRPIRDYCFVRDLAGAVVSACAYDGSGCATFNAGSGIGTSVAQVAAEIAAIAGAQGGVIEHGGQRRPENVELLELVADAGAAARDLGWQTETSLHDGLVATIAAMRVTAA